MKSEREVVIVAPHVDDELIGCYSILINEKISPIIIYTEEADSERRGEALKLKTELPNIKAQFFSKTIPATFIKPSNTIYVPDPYFERHPAHRKIGMVGEQIIRDGLCYNVIFYSVEMNAPYIRETVEPKKKMKLLNKVYRSQKSLWQCDNKYFLFEGFCKWIFETI